MEWKHIPSTQPMEDISGAEQNVVHVLAYNVDVSGAHPFMQVLLELAPSPKAEGSGSDLQLEMEMEMEMEMELELETKAETETELKLELDLIHVPLQVGCSLDTVWTDCTDVVRAFLPGATTQFHGVWWCASHDLLVAMVEVGGDFSSIAVDNARARVQLVLPSELVDTRSTCGIPVCSSLCDVVSENPDLVRLYDATGACIGSPCAVYTSAATEAKSKFQLLFGPSPSKALPLCQEHFFFHRQLTGCESSTYVNRYALFQGAMSVVLSSDGKDIEEAALEGVESVVIYYRDEACARPDMLVRQFAQFTPLSRHVNA